MDGRQRGQVTMGIVLIVLGLIFFVGQQVSGLGLHRLWPVLLLVFGLGQLMWPRHERRGRRGGGFWMVFTGGIFLLHNFNVLSLGQSWPLFVVAAGLSIVFHDRLDPPAQARDNSHGE